ncbi:Uu.00g103700.m01.CDS01 [Anthostomella pinea]|uniref:Uu.00g103700.m01.CDS01 n=1 Tax=Anthostomella pinea TaxID=933095 RepID=A0AAI8VEM1_9PEZI|nr:Uu.00g103700.m01.CDS01 [Anthostomella pinea]
MAPPTILAHKSTFITAQTLHLSQNLAPSAAWRSINDRAQQGGLSGRVVDEALYRLNHALQQHARRVYAPQASRHVAEQIEGLFLAAGERAARGEEDDEEEDGDGDGEGDGEGGGNGVGGVGRRGRLRLGADFATDETISALPPTWDIRNASEAEARPVEVRRYADLAASLTSLSARRKEARKRVERLRRMDALLAPFRGDGGDGGGGGGGVQENLVTRNGEVEKELERMRTLLVRVAGRVAQLPDADAGTEDQTDDVVMADLDMVEREKVERLLAGF